MAPASGLRCLRMTDLLLALLHLAVMTAKLCGPGGVRAVIAENLLLKQQLIVLRRARRRAPNLALSDRLICAVGSLFLSRVLVVMDQLTRCLVGVGVQRGPVNGADLCRMFNAAIHGRGTPRHLSTDHDPLFEAHRWTRALTHNVFSRPGGNSGQAAPAQDEMTLIHP